MLPVHLIVGSLLPVGTVEEYLGQPVLRGGGGTFAADVHVQSFPFP
jgi:hypothetical protein